MLNTEQGATVYVYWHVEHRASCVCICVLTCWTQRKLRLLTCTDKLNTEQAGSAYVYWHVEHRANCVCICVLTCWTQSKLYLYTWTDMLNTEQCFLCSGLYRDKRLSATEPRQNRAYLAHAWRHWMEVSFTGRRCFPPKHLLQRLGGSQRSVNDEKLKHLLAMRGMEPR
jgi:hypothetical protein